MVQEAVGKVTVSRKSLGQYQLEFPDGSTRVVSEDSLGASIVFALSEMPAVKIKGDRFSGSEDFDENVSEEDKEAARIASLLLPTPLRPITEFLLPRVIANVSAGLEEEAKSKDKAQKP